LKDFNEIPSILLENWIWTPSVLKKMGCHYSYLSPESLAAWASENKGVKRPERELADDSIEQLLGTKQINEASTVLKRCSIDYFDMKIHGPNSREELEKMDLSEEWNRLLVEVSTMHGAEAMGWKWGNGPSRLGMLIRGYDAGCYSYVL
jgi:metallopeptidase MepB